MIPEDRLARAVDEFFDLVAAGKTVSPFDFADSLGSRFEGFLRAVEAKAALRAVVEPAPVTEPPEELGSFTLLRKLGQGGGGAVYEARDRRTGGRVALKLIHASLADDADQVRRFQREGRLGAQLRHAHLVEVHETGSIGGRPYCSMQLVEGPTLKQRIRDGALPFTRENLEQLAGVADGLAAIHRAGIVHRDVKPSNILIAPDGRFLLGDFGLVRERLETTITRTGEALGTIGYMSPEQLRGEGEGVDARTDVYSLGATLFETFCGRLPVDAGTLANAFLDPQRHAPPDPRSVRPDLPPELGAVIRTALERRPEDRYQTAEAMRDDLRRLSEGGPVVGRPVSPFQRWLRRRRGLVLSLVAVAVAAGAFGLHLATRPATVVVECHPPATVLVDGVAQGRTPLSLALDPGDHEVTLERERFAPRRLRLTLARGGNPVRTCTLLPADLTDLEAMRILAESLDLELEPFEIATDRSGGVLPAGHALLPRGRCRLADLAGLRLETSDEGPFPLPARLVFRRGDEVLLEEPLAELQLVHETPFPAAVRSRIRAGDAVVWGLQAGDGREFLATLQVVEEDEGLREALARLDRDLGDAPAALRAFFRAQAFLAAGMPMAAYREVSDAPDGGVLSLGTSLRALRALDADDSRLGDALRIAVGALPVRQQSDWFR